MSKAIRVGIIGLGTMGSTHLAVYRQLDGAEVVAIASVDGRSGPAGGNIAGQGGGSAEDLDVEWFADGLELIASTEVDLIDICTPTPTHLALATAAIDAGRHVLIEKPVDLRSERVRELAAAADRAGVVAMPAMCMRFWPGWDWLKRAVDERRYGRVLSAGFARLASHPGGAFYQDADACGGALFDLHIHDADFIQYALGMPKRVSSVGYSHVTGGVDHVVTRYDFGEGGPLVTAEGGWAMAAGFDFVMRFTVNFERATARFDLADDPPLKLTHEGRTSPVSIAAGMGYEGEIRYLIDCLTSGRRADRSTLASAVRTTAIVEAEAASIASGGEPVDLQNT